MKKFRNLCASLAEKHQLFYLGSGPRFPSDVVVEKCTEFVMEDYNDDIREAVISYNFDSVNILVAQSVSVKGTEYKSKMVVVVAHTDDGLLVGKIKHALIHKGSHVFFIIEKYPAEFDVYYIGPTPVKGYS